MNGTAGEAVIRELAEFALPIPERHFAAALDAAAHPAAEEDPLAPA